MNKNDNKRTKMNKIPKKFNKNELNKKSTRMKNSTKTIKDEQKSNKMNKFFMELPIVIVKHWNMVTKEWLLNNHSEHLSRLSEWKSENPTWIYPQYWMNR